MAAATEADSRRGRCYELAADHVLEHGSDASLQLCHGWPVMTAGPNQGRRYGHAWAERVRVLSVPYQGQALQVEVVECQDTVSGDWLPAALWYKAGQIDPDHVARYTLAQACEQLHQSGTYGPWGVCPYEGAL
jgi:hypothetical protein